jgi:hypothetical protein
MRLKKCAKSENFNFPSISISVNNSFKFSAENSELAHFLNCIEISDKKLKIHAISSYKDHFYKDQVLNPPEFKDH